MTFSKRVSKRPNLCRNDSYIFGQKHVAVAMALCRNCLCQSIWHPCQHVLEDPPFNKMILDPHLYLPIEKVKITIST